MNRKQALQLVHDGQLVISTGLSRKETAWKPREMLWSALAARLSQTTRTAESVVEYRAFSKAKQNEIKDVGGFVGGVLSGKRRKAGTVKWRQVITLDADSIQGDFWPSVQKVLNNACLIYATHKHTPEKPRLRLVIPTARPMTPEEYIPVARRIAGDIGIDWFDDTTYEPHRLMYWPSTSVDGAFVFEVQDGVWLNPDDVLARYDDWRDPRLWPESSRCVHERKKLAEKQGDPLEKPGIVGAFCRSYTIPCAIETFLKDAYTPNGPGRYTFAEGSTAGGLVVYDDERFAFSHHGTDPASGLLCNAFDLVRIHLFGDLDEDADEDTRINLLPSFKAMEQRALEDDAVKAEFAQTKLGEAREAFKDDLDWVKLLKVNKNGFIPSRDNILTILTHDPNLFGHYAYNEFRECPVVLDKMPWDEEKRISEVWGDVDDSGLFTYLEDTYGIDNAGKATHALGLAFQRSRIHPVRDYLDALVWDGKPRIDTLLHNFLGAQDTTYVQTVTRRALVGAVARIYTPGCKHDHMLVLIGAQGTGKSTLLRLLGGKWYSDSLYTVQGKEAYEQLQGAWIIEMGEMAATRKAEVEAVKQFISKQTDRYRAAYGRRVEEHPRQCAFFGTTNDDEFLHDATGGRRFWPVTVGENGKTKDLWTELDVEQVWAEAVAAYQTGEAWHLDVAMEREARKEQEKHTEGNAKLGLIQDYLEVLLPENWSNMDLYERRLFLKDDQAQGTIQRDRVCAIEIWCELFDGDMRNFELRYAREINNMLRVTEGWKRYETETGKQRFGKLYGIQRAFVRCP